MYKGKNSGNGFLLFHDSHCLVSQTTHDYGSLEHIQKRLALTLIYAFFVEQDGPYLAELKANKLWKCAKPHLPKDLEFEISDVALAEVIEKTIVVTAPDWFSDFCRLDIDLDNFVYVLE